jgi:hypothetical protein
MYADELHSTDLMCERASMIAHLAGVHSTTKDPKSKRMIMEAMEALLRSIASEPASVTHLKVVQGKVV